MGGAKPSSWEEVCGRGGRRAGRRVAGEGVRQGRGHAHVVHRTYACGQGGPGAQHRWPRTRQCTRRTAPGRDPAIQYHGSTLAVRAHAARLYLQLAHLHAQRAHIYGTLVVVDRTQPQRLRADVFPVAGHAAAPRCRRRGYEHSRIEQLLRRAMRRAAECETDGRAASVKRTGALRV
eukprot:136363-Chlamydomonas_euryale.AAC.2